MNDEIECFLVSPMVKVFPNQRPQHEQLRTRRVLKGEKIHVQIVYTAKTVAQHAAVSVRVRSSLAASMFDVRLVPNELVQWPDADDGYLSKQAGLYPDCLIPSQGEVRAYLGQYRSLWVTLDSGKLGTGKYDWQLTAAVVGQPETVFTETVTIEVLADTVQKPRLMHTEWFHVDSLAQYYQLKPYSEDLWERIEQFVRFAVAQCGVNLLLTPIYTPPLDTAVGKERLNVQLIEVNKTDSGFNFGLKKLRRWCAICRQAGIENLEFPPLFTQWGAKKTPNIYLDNSKAPYFGWQTDALDTEYHLFLETLIPTVIATCAEFGYGRDHLYFHISDEPGLNQQDSYLRAKRSVRRLLDGYHIIDALANRKLLLEKPEQVPVVADDALPDFLASSTTPLWTYYCCSQSRIVPNRFMALPSFRNRVLGVLLYKYQIQGFLHWGYNFYNSAYSESAIDPFAVTDGGGHFPGGDSFLVYPGPNGPYSSIRNEVQMLAFADLALLQQLERLSSRATVLKLINHYAGIDLSFEHFPQNFAWLDNLLEATVDAISQIQQ